MVPDLQPKVPCNLPLQGRELLESLAGVPEAAEFVLGGGIALGHYAEYRRTHYVDAWWRSAPDEAAWAAATERMRTLAQKYVLEYGERSWGTTRSAELRAGSQKRFSFQISRREVGLDEPLPSHWTPLLIETFRDNLAAKMNALVGRGAPRDFQDIHEVFQRSLAGIEDCWSLWRLKNPGNELAAAQRAVLNHLARIESRRPLATVPATERPRADAIRHFVHDRLCLPYD